MGCDYSNYRASELFNWLSYFLSKLAIGSGPRYQILSHVFARCVSQKTYGHARIARESRMAIGFFGFLTRAKCKKVWHKSYTSSHCLVGNGIKLEAVGLQFWPYWWRPCGVTWDSSRTVVVRKLLRTSALFAKLSKILEKGKNCERPFKYSSLTLSTGPNITGVLQYCSLFMGRALICQLFFWELCHYLVVFWKAWHC